MKPLRTGELARRAGVIRETLRFYERRGLLPRPPRTPSGYRTWPPETVERVRFIRRAQEIGFTLREIRGLLELRVDSRTPCAFVRRRAADKLRDIDRRLTALQRMRAAVRRLVTMCSGRGPVSECPILEALSAERR
jgi:MerR family mercuric resistance operon transcriptional regulator